MKILVLDDHEGFRREMEDILTRNGHHALGVATAKVAIPLVEKEDYDYVLVDYHMPEHDGLWFMKHVNLPKGTRALLVTSHVNKELINTMFKVGVSGYIIKPFEEADLIRHLDFHSGPPAGAGQPTEGRNRQP